jgi:sugar-specific transcriptional regulator TrmB
MAYFEGKIIVSTEEVQQKLAEAERNTLERKAKVSKKKRPVVHSMLATDKEDIDEDSEIEGHEIQDCIEVELR